MIITQGVYQHYKGGLYTVLFLTTDADNGADRESRVVYVSLTTGRVFSRSVKEFTEKVGDRLRFQYISDGLDTLSKGPVSALQHEIVRLRTYLNNLGYNPDLCEKFSKYPEGSRESGRESNPCREQCVLSRGHVGSCQWSGGD